MERKDRDRLKKLISSRHQAWLLKANPPEHLSFEDRLKRTQRDCGEILRKEHASKNSLKLVPRISRSIFGILEDVDRMKLPPIDMGLELHVVSNYLVAYLDSRLASRYDGRCASYGESLLNAYLDLMITFSVLRCDKDMNINPHWLRYPLTNSLLEIDVQFEDFRLCFEFQGDHHYTNPRDIAKDAFKRERTVATGRVLIPVNVSQLHSQTLVALVANSLCSHLGFHEVGGAVAKRTHVNAKCFTSFAKAVQRLWLAKRLFGSAFAHIDHQSSAYIESEKSKGRISAISPAPIASPYITSVDVREIYQRIPEFRRASKLQ
jgi:hypothetical protein